jgi:hypothetical protein
VTVYEQAKSGLIAAAGLLYGEFVVLRCLGGVYQAVSLDSGSRGRLGTGAGKPCFVRTQKTQRKG